MGDAVKVGRHAGILDAQGDLRRADQAEFSPGHAGRHRKPTVDLSPPPGVVFPSPNVYRVGDFWPAHPYIGDPPPYGWGYWGISSGRTWTDSKVTVSDHTHPFSD